ncbi:MAG TPA: hypothetical protein VHV82_18620 [Sporichthyaceae bacterium]|nr:hypothetical protein [Sporichthyaceae bacterium]
MLGNTGLLCRRPVAAALVGTGALVAALIGSPANAFIQPPPNGSSLTYGTGTLALCVGAQQGATGYTYAEGVAPVGAGNPVGMDLIPSQLTQLLAGPGGLDCRAYPADPGSYQITTYKFPQAPCPSSATGAPLDKTRPNNPAGANTPAGECLAKIHHIHIIHMAGAVTTVSATGVPSLNGTPFGSGTPTDGGTTPECWTAVTPAIGTGACGTGDGHDFGLEYTTELFNPPLPEDTVIDQPTVIVTVRAGETTEVITHLPDHETSDCFSNFGPDVNGNNPVCN